jgi:hypothetical protein
MTQHRGSNWTPEEDGRLLDLMEAGKSRVFSNCGANQKSRAPV